MALPFKKLIENKFVSDLIFALAPFETYPHNIRLKIDQDQEFDWGVGLVKSTRVCAEVKLWNATPEAVEALGKVFSVYKEPVAEYGEFNDLRLGDYEIGTYYPILSEDLRKKKRAMQMWVARAPERFSEWQEREAAHQRAVRRSIDPAIQGLIFDNAPTAKDKLGKYEFLYQGMMPAPLETSIVVEAADKTPKMNFRSRFKSRIKNP